MIYLFILLLPVQLGTFFFFDFSYINGVRVDYLAPALYLTDILAFILILQHIFLYKKLIQKKVIILFSLLLLNILFAHSSHIGFYRMLKIIEILMLSIIFNNIHVDQKKIMIAFLIGAFVELFLAISQMTTQSSLQGIWYFLGERSFDISTPGIAKVALQGIEILRPYGTFSHPNSLAGFYLILYTFILFEKKFQKFVSLKYLCLGVSALLILLSFSKVTIISFLIINIFFVIQYSLKKCALCGGSKIVVAVVLASLFLVAKGDHDSIQKRIYLTQSAFSIIFHHPFQGVGLGNYLYAQSAFANPYPYHFLEPVHNIFLLMLTELGILICLILGYFLFPFVKKIWETDTGKSLLLIILFTGMFDHYWLTLQQNMLLLPVIFGLLQKGEDMLQ